MLRALLELKRPDVPKQVALRNTAAVVTPLIVGAATHHLPVGLAVSTGAMMTMFSDQPGPYPVRMRRMLLTAAWAAVSAFAGLIFGSHPVIILIITALWSFWGALFVALGPDAGRAGLIGIILLVVAAANPQAPRDAITISLLTLCGGLIQTLLAIVAWPLQRYRPERLALATVFDEIAQAARLRLPATAAPPATQSLIDLQTMLYEIPRRQQRIAIQALRVLAEIAERIRLNVLTLVDTQERLEGDVRDRIHAALDSAADVMDDLATALREDAAPVRATATLERFQTDLAALQAAAQAVPRQTRTRVMAKVATARMRDLDGALRAAIRHAGSAGSRGELREMETASRLPGSLRPDSARAILRANMSLASVDFRHAIRSAICITLALATERALQIPHGYWVPMTVAIVLKPDFSGTFTFAILRVLGTAVGLGLVTWLLLVPFDRVGERIALLGLLCFGYRMLMPVHYGIAVTLLTALVVVQLSFLGQAASETIVDRGISTALGCAFALLVYTAWPTWERHQIRPALAALLDASRLYFATVSQRDARTRVETRLAVRRARSNVEASLLRLKGEPRPDRTLIEFSDRVFANANRLSRAVMDFEAVLDAPTTSLPDRPTVTQFAARVDKTLSKLARVLRGDTDVELPGSLRRHQEVLARDLDESVRPDDRERVGALALIQGSDRLTDALDTLTYVLRDHDADQRSGARPAPDPPAPGGDRPSEPRGEPRPRTAAAPATPTAPSAPTAPAASTQASPEPRSSESPSPSGPPAGSATIQA